MKKFYTIVFLFALAVFFAACATPNAQKALDEKAPVPPTATPKPTATATLVPTVTPSPTPPPPAVGIWDQGQPSDLPAPGGEEKEAPTPPTATPTPAPAEVAAASADTQNEPKWVELEQEFEAAGDVYQTFSVDHNGSPKRVTIGWFHAAFEYTKNPEPCSVVVVTAPRGARITILGAKRTWQWSGESDPTLEQQQQLVGSWIGVLEAEARGACAHEGSYSTILWQNAEVAQPTATPTPAQSEAKPTPAPRREPTASPTATATDKPQQFNPADQDSILLTQESLPKEWSPTGSSNLAICWGSAKIVVSITATTLEGDACRVWLVPAESVTQTVHWFRGVLQEEYPEVRWELQLQ